MRSAAAFDDLVLLCRRTCGDSRGGGAGRGSGGGVTEGR